MNYLFLFTIGPVQPFIENSRKARDMYGGSKLLSETMELAVSWISRHNNAEVIFPQVGSAGPSDIPNRMIVRFPDIEETILMDLADKLTVYVKHGFLDRCIEILKSAGISGDGLVLAEDQLKEYLEVYWLYEKCEDGCYIEAYKKLFSGIQAVKGIRLLSQTKEPWGRKCILFPEYSAIFAKKAERKRGISYPEHVNPKAVWDLTANATVRYAVKNNEAMSALALVKRMYNRREIELYSIRLMLLKNKINEEVFPELKICPNDEVANALYDRANNNLEADEYSDEAVGASAVLYEYIQQNEIRLSFYYALVKFDGDDMGTHFLSKEDENGQRELSERIGDFAKQVPRIFREHGGLPVYAGGEDFFGYLPVNTLFDCIMAMRQAFQFKIEGTFSAGIAVAHVMQPLKEVAALANEMVKKAKTFQWKGSEPKNAFAIGIIKRSGETLRMPPYKMDCACGLYCMKDVKHLINLLKESGCSKSLIFNICHLFEQFISAKEMPGRELAEILVRELLTASHYEPSKINENELLKDIMLFYSENYGVQGFIDTLNGIAFLAREVGE